MRKFWPAAIWLGSSTAGGLIAVSFAFWLKGFGDPWISFAGGVLGGVIGGAMTIGAGYIAWRGVEDQNELTRALQRSQSTETSILRMLAADRCRIFADSAIDLLDVVIDRPADGRTVHAYYFEILQAQSATNAAIDIGHYTLRYALRDAMSDVRKDVSVIPAFEYLTKLADAGALDSSIVKLRQSLARLKKDLAAEIEGHNNALR